MYCPNCGKPVPDKAAYCIQCGTPVPKRKAPKKRKTWLLIPVIAVLGLCFIIAGLFSGVRVEKLDEAKAQSILNDVLRDFFQEASDQPILQNLQPYTDIWVDSVKKQKDGYMAECTVTTLDLQSCILDFLSELDPTATGTYADAQADLLDALDDADIMTETFHVAFILSDGQYVPVFSQELMDFCSGNLPLLLEDLAELAGGNGL